MKEKHIEIMETILKYWKDAASTTKDPDEQKEWLKGIKALEEAIKIRRARP